VLHRLPTIIPRPPERPQVADAEHPIRKVTRQIAFEPTGWDAERRAKLAELFDGLAPTWHERQAANEHDALLDALERGGPYPAGPCLEVGSGTGAFTAELSQRFEPVFSVDLSGEMLRRARGPRVLADSAELPVPTGSAAAVVLVNMFLFPHEIDRVLQPGGALVWVSVLGDATPIYLSAEDVDEALPGDWAGTAADAGWGSWAVFRKPGS
jgi:SAM-dependent methyltransferase